MGHTCENCISAFVFLYFSNLQSSSADRNDMGRTTCKNWFLVKLDPTLVMMMIVLLELMKILTLVMMMMMILSMMLKLVMVVTL